MLPRPNWSHWPANTTKVSMKWEVQPSELLRRLPCTYEFQAAALLRPHAEPRARHGGTPRGGTGRPRVRTVLHRSHGDRPVDPGAGLARPEGSSVRAPHAGPGGHGV